MYVCLSQAVYHVVSNFKNSLKFPDLKRNNHRRKKRTFSIIWSLEFWSLELIFLQDFFEDQTFKNNTQSDFGTFYDQSKPKFIARGEIF